MALTVSFSGTVTVGGVTYPESAGSVTLGTPAPPAAPAAVPHPPALAAGHTLTAQYLPAGLYAWRFKPGTTVPATNGSGVTADPGSPRNVTVTTDGDLPVLRLSATSPADCGVIQSPGRYPTASGVIEALVKFSGITAGTGFSCQSALWMYGDGWPAGGELDAVETKFGNSYVSYHYGTGTGSQVTTDPWTYPAKTAQLAPKNSTGAPAPPNIIPGQWTYVTLAFGRDATGNYRCEVFYNGTLYCTVAGPYVTGSPMFLTVSTSFSGPVPAAGQAPYDQPGTVDIQYVRIFS